MATLQELRDLSPQELRKRAAELKQSLFELRNKAHTGVLDSTADLLKTKRDIARCLTVAREKELAEARAAAPARAQGASPR
ncbi:MAG TPA: 50S ribosomal protein L29 [Anaeromyxobacter sp.]|nr:50S ribosomal protein L29 [Anaeromyxobacter sp.]